MCALTSPNRARKSSSRPSGTSKQLMNRTTASSFGMHLCATSARRYSPGVTTGQGVRPGGREAQKRRTRTAIVAATRELVAGGRTPSIDEIAVAADVSRRTIYLHFPTLDQLLLDAASGLLAETTVDARLVASEEQGQDALARTDALARGLSEVAPSALPLGRKLIALTVDAG